MSRGGSVSVASSDIYMSKMEEDVVVPAYPMLYKRYVDDTYIQESKILMINYSRIWIAIRRILTL